MTRPLVRALALLGVVLALVPPGTGASARVAQEPARRLEPAVAAAAARADGVLVRRDGPVTVDRVRVDDRDLYRVTVAGRFPPRALRYVVLAGGREIGSGVPDARGRSVTAVTADDAVLTAPITVRYGDSETPQLSTSITGRGSPSAADVDDPAAFGPYEVSRDVYDFGDRAFQPSELPGKVEIRADVHHPTGLPDGPYPLVLFMHGNHWSCFSGDRVTYRWPCRSGWEPLPNHEGYDYIARRLASHGFVVVSVSANGVNVLGNWAFDTGMRQRGEVLDRHLDLWRGWATVGGDPFGDAFVGKVDLSVVGTMGHSRGGEGVVWHTIVDGERPDPYGVDAVLALAPVDFTRATINGIAFSVLLPYCDGDVFDLQGVHFFDDSRYLVPGDPTPKTTVTAFRANHNFFNTVWSPGHGYPGGFDDGLWSGCRVRLTQPEQRRVGLAYVVGFFRRYLADETALEPMWTGAVTPASIAPATTLVSYLAPDDPSMRLDVARYTDPRSLGVGEGGGAVRTAGLGVYGWCADTWELPCVANAPWVDVHLPGLGQGILGWSGSDGVVSYRLPPGQRDMSGFDAFQLRAAVDPGYWINPPGYQDLVVALVDGGGNVDEVTASEVGNDALRFPLTRRGVGHFILNQVRFPLDAFAGVDLGDVRAVELRFSRTPGGVIHVADAAFASGAS
jgi:hypothetical protein